MSSSPAGSCATPSRAGKGAGVNPVPNSRPGGGPVWLGIPSALLAANDARLPSLCRMAQQLLTASIGVQARSKKLLIDAHKCLRDFQVDHLRAPETGTETFPNVENSFPRFGKKHGFS